MLQLMLAGLHIDIPPKIHFTGILESAGADVFDMVVKQSKPVEE